MSGVRVSQIYHLAEQQSALDFVDVDVTTDVRVFVDPRAIRIQQGEWHNSCIDLLKSFFHEVLAAISKGDSRKAMGLLDRLTEPNETHLGLSKGRSRGHGLGGVGARMIVSSIQQSRAAQSGLLEDLEDTALFIDGIGPDIVSDITTNVIRGALLGYTQQVCDDYGIPVYGDRYAGWVWDENNLEWTEVHADLPVVNDEILLLVPRSVVRVSLICDSTRYYRRAIAPLHEQKEIQAGSGLVYALKSGVRKVNKDALIKRYGNSKSDVTRHTEDFPEAFRRFKNTPGMAETPPLSHEQLAERTQSDDVDFQSLLDTAKSVLPGSAGATLFHRAVKDFLSAIFYPFLGNVVIEKEIHDGRKRIDINFDNIATAGFFKWIGMHHSASQVVVECKNYTREVANPELDQITGRFSPHRTQFGIVVCRKIEDKKLMAKRCRDTAKDQRGFIFFLDDEDLDELKYQYTDKDGAYPLLREQFDYLIG